MGVKRGLLLVGMGAAAGAIGHSELTPEAPATHEVTAVAVSCPQVAEALNPLVGTPSESGDGVSVSIGCVATGGTADRAVRPAEVTLVDGTQDPGARIVIFYTDAVNDGTGAFVGKPTIRTGEGDVDIVWPGLQDAEPESVGFVTLPAIP